MDSSTPLQEDWNLHSPIREDWHRKEFETPPTMLVDEISREQNSAPARCDCKQTCCNCRYIINIDGGGSCFDRSKFFDSNAESATLDCSFSTSTSSTFPREKSYWICTKCRHATMDPKHSFGRINDIVFYCCDPCWSQLRMQRWLGFIFRMIQIHLCFTTLWIKSPDGAFLGDRSRNYGEWVAIVVLLVITLLFQIASFINVIFIRPISELKRIQKKRPILDLWLEWKCALCWVAIIGVMIHDGVRQYGRGRWNGALIGLIVCAFVMLLSYLLTTIVAWRNLLRTTKTVINGFPDPFGQRRKKDVWQAITFLS